MKALQAVRMRSPLHILLIMPLLATMAGCVSVSRVSYPGLTKSEAPEHIRVYAVKDKQQLQVALPASGTNQFLFSAADSELIDARGASFRLDTQPSDLQRSSYIGNQPWNWYSVHAYGPVPAASPVSFASGRYTIALAYDIDGARQVTRTSFEVHRSSVPFFVVWFDLIIHPVGPCG